MPADSDATPRASRFAWPLLAALGLAWGIAALAGESAGEPTGSDDPLRGAQQLVLVTTGGWDENQGILRRFERPDDSTQWREVAAFPVSIGRNGSAWGTGLHAAGDQDEGPRKREGDGRSPAGVFALGTAFGYADTVASGLPYQAMTRDDWCMDVPASPYYNRIVDARQVGAAAVAGSSEPMRLDLHRNGNPSYRLGFVIEHKPQRHPHDRFAPERLTARSKHKTDLGVGLLVVGIIVVVRGTPRSCPQHGSVRIVLHQLHSRRLRGIRRGHKVDGRQRRCQSNGLRDRRWRGLPHFVRKRGTGVGWLHHGQC